jgi:fatty-acyl-CoA synthase
MIGAQVILLYFPEAKTIADLIQNHKITFTCLPPTLYVRLLRVDNLKPAVKSLRRCISFGATIPKQMIEDWNAVAPHIEWISLYASSELSATGTAATFSRIDEIPEADMNWVGKPAPLLEIRIVGPYNKDAPIGETGEMVFRGPAVFKGYYKNEEKNREVFSDGWFHSGDMARMNAAGEVFFVDRIKDMVKSGGENISSSSIEFVVGTHPNVSECAVFGVPHPEWMEAVAVTVIPKQGKTITEGELIDYCKSKLPRFKVPKYVIVVEEFPRNPTGKILKRELKVMYKDIASQRPS